jgi:hypothetical protein
MRQYKSPNNLLSELLSRFQLNCKYTSTLQVYLPDDFYLLNFTSISNITLKFITITIEGTGRYFLYGRAAEG